MAGKVKVEIGNRIVYVGCPDPLQSYEAEEIYNSSLIDGRFLEMMNNNDMLHYLQDLGIWNISDQQFLDELPTKLETMKVEMYMSYSTFKSKRVEQIRRSITRLLNSSYDLFRKRHAYDNFTSEGFAFFCKTQYIVCVTASDVHGKHIDISNDYSLLQEVVQSYINSKVSESEIRELSRTEPWRSIWNAGKAEGQVFGVPATLLSDDQRHLISWSSLYDNVREASEPPDDEVLNDDLLMDGWLIVQSRKAEEEKKQQLKGSLGNKLSRASEVFIPAESAKDAQRIYQMNSAQARMIKRQRLQLVGKEGAMPEQNMPDAQLELRQKAIAQAKELAKKNRG